MGILVSSINYLLWIKDSPTVIKLLLVMKFYLSWRNVTVSIDLKTSEVGLVWLVSRYRWLIFSRNWRYIGVIELTIAKYISSRMSEQNFIKCNSTLVVVFTRKVVVFLWNSDICTYYKSFITTHCYIRNFSFFMCIFAS